MANSDCPRSQGSWEVYLKGAGPSNRDEVSDISELCHVVLARRELKSTLFLTLVLLLCPSTSLCVCVCVCNFRFQGSCRGAETDRFAGSLNLGTDVTTNLVESGSILTVFITVIFMNNPWAYGIATVRLGEN